MTAPGVLPSLQIPPQLEIHKEICKLPHGKKKPRVPAMAIDIPACHQALVEEILEEDVMGVGPEAAPSRPMIGRTAATKRNEAPRKRSSPVSIPAGKSGSSPVMQFLCRSADGSGDGDDDQEEEMVPPHIIVARRFAGGGRKTAFSLCAGNGRTLKGWDMRRVRNSVLMQTGFLEGHLTS